MLDNPNPKKYVIKIRRGKAILVDKQILRWRKRRKKAAQTEAAKALEEIQQVDTSKILHRKFFE
jgi:hypothetical protein